jgi:hypothetical protein
MGRHPVDTMKVSDTDRVTSRPKTRQYVDLSGSVNGYCPNHSTGVKLPDDFVVTQLRYVD